MKEYQLEIRNCKYISLYVDYILYTQSEPISKKVNKIPEIIKEKKYKRVKPSEYIILEEELIINKKNSRKQR